MLDPEGVSHVLELAAKLRGTGLSLVLVRGQQRVWRVGAGLVAWLQYIRALYVVQGMRHHRLCELDLFRSPQSSLKCEKRLQSIVSRFAIRVFVSCFILPLIPSSFSPSLPFFLRNPQQYLVFSLVKSSETPSLEVLSFSFIVELLPLKECSPFPRSGMV